MPVNKAARFRFEIIDECLRNTRKKWSKKELLKYVNRRLELQFGEGNNISISQIRYDIENMQSDYGAPIELYRIGKNYYYRYEEENFSIKNIPVSEEEIQYLNVALSVLKQVKFYSLAEDIAGVITKLESRYNFNVNEEKDIIIFESAQNESGKMFLEDIYYAIIRKIVLKISLSHKPGKFVNVHPYLLKQYNNIWHLAGHCQETNKIEFYEIDRMKEVKISNLPYIADLFMNIENHFRNIVGVTKPTEEVHKVRLLFHAEKAWQVLSHPLHPTQVVEKEHANGSIELSLEVIINKELIDLLLGFGPYVTVLSPEKLATDILKIAKSILSTYAVCPQHTEITGRV